MTSTRATRNIRRLPWVTRLKRSSACQGVISGQSSKAFREGNARFCKLPAWWHFKALSKSYTHSGNYCWQHLIYGCIEADMLESTRTDTWFTKHGIVE